MIINTYSDQVTWGLKKEFEILIVFVGFSSRCCCIRISEQMYFCEKVLLISHKHFLWDQLSVVISSRNTKK